MLQLFGRFVNFRGPHEQPRAPLGRSGKRARRTANSPADPARTMPAAATNRRAFFLCKIATATATSRSPRRPNPRPRRAQAQRAARPRRRRLRCRVDCAARPDRRPPRALPRARGAGPFTSTELAARTATPTLRARMAQRASGFGYVTYDPQSRPLLAHAGAGARVRERRQPRVHRGRIPDAVAAGRSWTG